MTIEHIFKKVDSLSRCCTRFWEKKNPSSQLQGISVPWEALFWSRCFNISTMCPFLSKTWKPPLITLNVFLVTILCGEFSSLGHSFRLMFLFCIGFWDVYPPPNLIRALYNECAKGSSLLIIFNYSLILSHQITCLYCQNLRTCARAHTHTHNLRHPFLFSHQAVGSNLTLSLIIW